MDSPASPSRRKPAAEAGDFGDALIIKRYGHAEQVLQNFLDQYQSSSYRNEALFGWRNRNYQNHQAALQTSERIAKGSRLYDFVLYGRGWSYLRLEAWQQAIAAFQEVTRSYQQSSVRADAMYRIAEGYRQLGDAERERRAYANYLSAYPQGAKAPAAQLQLALPSGPTSEGEQSIEALQQISQFPGRGRDGRQFRQVWPCFSDPSPKLARSFMSLPRTIRSNLLPPPTSPRRYALQ